MEERFGRGPELALGVEEELLLVDAARRLAPDASRVLAAMAPAAGEAKPDMYEASIELASPPSRSAAEAVEALVRLRAGVREAGGTALGAGIHPDGAFGDAAHVEGERYRRVGEELRGLQRRTPTCALHVHVGMPDAQAAITAFNALREHLPLLQGLAANSPFWHGVDSGLASARSALFRALPRAEIPRAFRDIDDWEETVAATIAAGGLDDYTFLWWDIRPHPRLGTVEVRAMDSQSSLATVAGLAALVQALARAALERAPGTPAPTPREALTESSFRASRDGVEATVLADGRLRPLREVGAAAVALARPHARDLGSEGALEEVERVLREGGGAARQRRAFAAGGMEGLLEGLVEETAGGSR